MLSTLFLSPGDVLIQLGQRAKAARLKENFSRATLAAHCGVPESTIKRFESCGEIGTASMLQIAFALDMSEHFESLFAPKPYRSLDEITAKERQRGRK